MDPREVRLLALERKQARLGVLLRQLRQGAVGIGQTEWGISADVAGPPPGPATCAASYSGAVDGCNNSPLAGVLVTLTDHTTGAPLGTATTDASGAFSGTITINSAGQAVDVTPAGCAPTTFGFHCGVNSLGSFNPGPGAGFVCAVPCNTPIPTTITVVDGLYGPFTAHYTSGGSPGNTIWSTGGQSVNYAGSGICPAAPFTISYSLNAQSNGVWLCVVTYNGNTNTSCPGGGAAGLGANPAFVSSACPPAFAINFKSAAGPLYLHSPAGTYTVNWTSRMVPQGRGNFNGAPGNAVPAGGAGQP